MVDENAWHDDESVRKTATPGVHYSERDKVYWFADEGEQLNGPYDSELEAAQALDLYARYL